MNEHVEFAPMETEADCIASFALMQQLRPHLTDAISFAEQVQRQRQNGYHLLAAREHGRVIGLAGYRLTENTLYGRFIYVDDLVVDAALQRRRLGEQLLERVREETRTRGYRYLVLDTGLHMVLAQRFYFRQGLLPRGMHFSQDLGQ
ncbi:N-acetyltransferase family protein [Pseudomonas sp. O39]|jgi:ribosomal protein S18 acetylase RimI-like enzyme|uniref:GNAT family N-acetyltransferase n=1 Tax=Pseudomonas sp. O39 TaxID=3379130 RepID=UPI00387AD82A